VQLLVGIAASAVVAGLALLRGALSLSGALAALLVGSAIWAGGGGVWFAALMAFFVTSTLLGRVGRARKEATKREFSKGDRRDAWQVLANGGVAAAAALGAALHPWAGHDHLWSALFVGALATANGDTWATELGVLSRAEPISLVRFRRVPRGTSGAVSPLGLAATLAGAALIGGVCAVGVGSGGGAWQIVVATIAGTAGSLGDSLLGATVQSRFHCPRCDKETEGSRHHCGALTTPSGGVGWFGNDAVNLAATLVGALVALLAS
jgi:uncharacterized protein (TIGR00297 family)